MHIKNRTASVLMAMTLILTMANTTFGLPQPESSLIATPTLEWVVDTGSPIIVRPGLSETHLYVHNLEGRLSAIERKTGKVVWERDLKPEGRSSPTFSNDMLFVLSGAGILHAIDSKTGESLWSFDSGEPEHPFRAFPLHAMKDKRGESPLDDFWDFSFGSPLVDETNVYYGDSDGCVRALDSSSGTLKWSFQTGDVVHAPLALSGEVVLAASFDATLYAIDRSDGSLLWSFETGRDPNMHNQQGHIAAPVVFDGKVYLAGRDAFLYVIELTSGRLVEKRYQNGSWLIATPAIWRNRIFFGTSDTTYLFRARTQFVNDTTHEVDVGEPLFASITIHEHSLLVPTFGGRLLALDPDTLETKWIFKPPSRTQDPYGMVNDSGLVDLNSQFGLPAYGTHGGDYDACLNYFERFYSIGAFFSSPCVADRTLWIGSADGSLYCLTLPITP